MKILINDEPVDFTLENERNLRDILGGIHAWLHESEYVASAIRLNGHAFSAGDPSETAEISDIDTIEVEAVQAANMPAQLITTLHQYLSLLVATLASGRAAVDTLGEFPYIRNALEQVLVEMLGEFGKEQFRILDTTVEELRTNPNGDSTEAVELLNSAVVLCESRLRELNQPERELAATAGLLGSLMEDVRDVPIQLQTGKDAEAMGTVVRFTELTLKLLRLLPSASEIHGIEIDGQALDDHIQGLNGILEELSEAFLAEDTVLVGDILEYEIVVRIESLIAAVAQRMEAE